MTRQFILGGIAIWFAKLHYRYEVRPYAEKNGIERSQIRAALEPAILRTFDQAWPEE
jgi:hypothetical protein